ncbi:Dihydroxyacetone kinase [Striga hermonthica]|uniref:Dihydroxyacetone kinase n=1 Tax=Striga hermonthica TaxID=68872 RepID=A0A9N7P4L1_STRHE|nr:Dihydroxyacetone kinase [Striga hermonthica]
MYGRKTKKGRPTTTGKRAASRPYRKQHGRPAKNGGRLRRDRPQASRPRVAGPFSRPSLAWPAPAGPTSVVLVVGCSLTGAVNPALTHDPPALSTPLSPSGDLDPALTFRRSLPRSHSLTLRAFSSFHTGFINLAMKSRIKSIAGSMAIAATVITNKELLWDSRTSREFKSAVFSELNRRTLLLEGNEEKIDYIFKSVNHDGEAILEIRSTLEEMKRRTCPFPQKLGVPIPEASNTREPPSQGELLKFAVEAALHEIMRDTPDCKAGDGWASHVLKKCYPLNDIKEAVNQIKTSIGEVMGGTMYDVFIAAAYAEIKATDSAITAIEWSRAFEEAIVAVSKSGGAKQGMLDALIPASSVLVLKEKLAAGVDPVEAFVLSAEAAVAGAESTKKMQD